MKKQDKFNLTGQRFGKWTVLEESKSKGSQGRHFKCRCDCGETKDVRGLDLRKGNSTKCKKCAREYGSTKVEMIGKIFGKWFVMDFAGKKHNSYQYLCRCECGTEKVLHGPSLRQGLTTQCHICGNRMKARKNITHGFGRHPLYKVWSSMKQRCNNPKSPAYHRYGGRGIKVCKRWEKFENFLKDMGQRPEGMTIERVNNDGDYCPQNCKWVTHKENCQNQERSLSKRNKDGS